MAVEMRNTWPEKLTTRLPTKFLGLRQRVIRRTDPVMGSQITIYALKQQK